MNYEFLSRTRLFQGIQPENIRQILSCLGAYEKTYPKGTLVFRSGDVTAEMCLVEEGSTDVMTSSYWGSSTILTHIRQGQCITATCAALPGKEMTCDVIASEDCTLLMVNVQKILHCCHNNCPFHHRLIQNLTEIYAARNRDLSIRISHIIPHSIRERLLSYLSEQRTLSGEAHFTIPFSRQQLADYLCVDRTALSKELSKLQKEGLLTYRKNEFTLFFDPSIHIK